MLSNVRRPASVDGLPDFLAAVQTAQQHRAAAIQQAADEVLEMAATKAEVEQLWKRIREWLEDEDIEEQSRPCRCWGR